MNWLQIFFVARTTIGSGNDFSGSDKLLHMLEVSEGGYFLQGDVLANALFCFYAIMYAMNILCGIDSDCFIMRYNIVTTICLHLLP